MPPIGAAREFGMNAKAEDVIGGKARPFTGAEYLTSLRDGARCGSNNIDYKQRIKVMKLLWDAVGTEFGGRHDSTK